jgi:aminoglycoside phosphotransferase (APT) family kinase protein
MPNPSGQEIVEFVSPRLRLGARFEIEPVASHSHLCSKLSRDGECYLLKSADDNPTLFRSCEAQRLSASNGACVPEIADVCPLPNALGFPFSVQKWISGAQARFQSIDAASLGRNVALIHSALTATPEYLHASDWMNACRVRLRNLVEANDKAANVSGETIREIAQRCARLIDDGACAVKQGLVHWDMHLGNVILKGSAVAAIVDFDRADIGDPLVDFAKLDAELFTLDVATFAPFLREYTKILPREPSFGCRIYLHQGMLYLSAASLLHLYSEREARRFHWLIERWLKNKRQSWDGPDD